MTEPGDRDEQIANLQADVAALHTRLGRAEQDAAAARFLAGGADRDGAETRSELRDFRDHNNRVLSAMRADMTDGFARIAEEFAQVDRNFIAVRGVLDATAAGQQQIVTRLDAVLRRQEDDRPPS